MSRTRIHVDPHLSDAERRGRILYETPVEGQPGPLIFDEECPSCFFMVPVDVQRISSTEPIICPACRTPLEAYADFDDAKQEIVTGLNIHESVG
jgi:hypothetical protein